MSRNLALNLGYMRVQFVPARSQLARNQSIGRIDCVILPEGAIGGIARRVQITVEGVAHLIPPLARLLLRGSLVGVRHERQPIGAGLAPYSDNGSAIASSRGGFTIGVGAAEDGVLDHSVNGSVVESPPGGVPRCSASPGDPGRVHRTTTAPAVRCQVPAPCRTPA